VKGYGGKWKGIKEIKEESKDHGSSSLC